MTSPHFDVCKKLATAVTTWKTSNWPAASDAEAVFQLEKLTQITEGDEAPAIGFLPTSVTETGLDDARRFDNDLVTISCIVLQRLSDFQTSTIETTDDKVAALRRYLQSVQTITVDSGEVAERQATKLFTVFDHDKLSAEVWASLILCEYTMESPELAEVNL